MSWLQITFMVICLAVYLLSILAFLAVCIRELVSKTLEKRTLRRQSQYFPCGRCRYFSNETLLKCAVRPVDVMTAAAQTCQDFVAKP
ncbi:MAG: hypothetical protein F6K00_25365 [Leptolyngbya sp. SIOISBB]|nr:hypothetical protein [Leptolyngbya sp. SIOISBB]